MKAGLKRLRGLKQRIHLVNSEPYTSALPGFRRVGLAKSGIEHGCHRYPSVEGIGAGGANSGNPVSALSTKGIDNVQTNNRDMACATRAGSNGSRLRESSP
jgi:hypothetical protein